MLHVSRFNTLLDEMKAGAWISGVLLAAFVLVFLQTRNSAEHHFREFESTKKNVNSYRPSLSDRIRGVRDVAQKLDFHLQRLVELGAVQHKRFVFTQVPYGREASSDIWKSAISRFPNAIWFTGQYYDTNSPAYGVEPCVLEVWDVPEEIGRWSSFFEQYNRKQ